jgi:hypothetical protein
VSAGYPHIKHIHKDDFVSTYENGQEGEDNIDGSEVRATGGEGVQEAVRQQGLTCHRVSTSSPDMGVCARASYGPLPVGTVTVCDIAMLLVPLHVASEAVRVRSITPAQRQRDATALIFGNVSDDSMLLLQPCVIHLSLSSVVVLPCTPPYYCILFLLLILLLLAHCYSILWTEKRCFPCLQPIVGACGLKSTGGCPCLSSRE